MSDMKCPFCGEKLYKNKPNLYDCRKVCCNKTTFMNGTKELWQELITTRKALDVALDALKEIYNENGENCINGCDGIANKALEQINKITKGGKDAK